MMNGVGSNVKTASGADVIIYNHNVGASRHIHGAIYIGNGEWKIAIWDSAGNSHEKPQDSLVYEKDS